MKKFIILIGLIISLMSLIGCNTGSGQNLSNTKSCNPNSLANQQCITNLDNLTPGQSNVGEYVITMEDGNLDKYKKKCENGSLEEDLLMRGSDYANLDFGGQTGVVAPQGIVGVITPNGKILLVNGHHHSYALKLLADEIKSGEYSKCNYDGHVYVYILDNYYNKKYKEEDGSLDNANQYMAGRLTFESRVWLKDSNYEAIKFNDLPKTLLEMGNDPYRSLIKLIQDDKCNEGSKKNPDFQWQQIINGDSIQPFIEFSWGERLRSMKISELGYDPYKNLPYDFNPSVEIQIESSSPSFKKGKPFYIMNPNQCITYSYKEKNIEKDENGIFSVQVKCKDVSSKTTREAYNYILQNYSNFRGLPGYNYKSIDYTYVCTNSKGE
jgi:hypothetical protein